MREHLLLMIFASFPERLVDVVRWFARRRKRILWYQGWTTKSTWTDFRICVFGATIELAAAADQSPDALNSLL
ncbi:MAG: hypothetical protein WAO01_06685, partial [Bradyrhizobium sp.]